MIIELFMLSMVTCLNLGRSSFHNEETVLTDETNEQFLVEINSYHCSNKVLEDFITGRTKLASTDLIWAK